ncbi:MAG: tRNA threonylcarbamoyladenosine dehydratase [Oscillospiraceae bacterium]|nr:tRNA threonylcarbamoyladenosine dehydratase [Oscillospiraceae bacterium]
MQDQFTRTRALLGKEAMEGLAQSSVAIFGLGGVGGYTAEALARSGIGCLALFDHDTVDITNLNRQIIATHKTVGLSKVQVVAERAREINPQIKVEPYSVFYGPETADDYDLSRYDYIVDAVDTVTAKLELVTRAHRANTPIISAMGTGNKLDPTAFMVTDLFQTKEDPLARVMRKELRKRGITALRVVCSEEQPRKPLEEIDPGNSTRRGIPASSAFVPGTAGLILAAEVVKALIT